MDEAVPEKKGKTFLLVFILALVLFLFVGSIILFKRENEEPSAELVSPNPATQSAKRVSTQSATPSATP